MRKTNPALSGLTGWNPEDDGLGLGLMQRARANREASDQESQSIADAYAEQYKDPQLAWNARTNNAKAGAMADPRWDAWFQANDEAAGGRPIRMVGAALPGSNQIAGFSAQPALDGLRQSDPLERKRRERLANIQTIDQESGAGTQRNAYYPTY